MYSRIIPGRLDRRSSARRGAFNGQFASLFPGAYQVLQTDRGLTYGGTMLPTAGNTSTTALTLTGSLATAPVPIWVRCMGGGAVDGVGAWFEIYYDGLGITPATFVFPFPGAPLALPGAGAGLSLMWSAGNAVLGDTWKVTCAALADQTANGNHAVQAGPTAQPIVALGLNGKVELIGDGVDDYLNTAGFQPPAGAMLYLVFRLITLTAFRYLTDSPGANRRTIYCNAGTATAHNGAGLAAGALGLGVNTRAWAIYNGASSSVKMGANAVANGDTGANVNVAGRTIMCVGNFGTFTNMALFALVWAPPGSTAAADAALNTAAGYGPGSIAV